MFEPISGWTSGPPSPLSIAPAILGERVAHLQADRPDDGLRRAADEAVHQGATVVALVDGQARVAVVMGRAAGLPAGPVAAGVRQPLEHALKRRHRAPSAAP